MNSLRPILSLLLVPVLLSNHARAEEEPENDQNTIIVTASRSEQRSFESVRSVDLVDQEQLEEAQVRSVPEALDEVTGVYLQQTNRGAGAPYIRGLVGPQNLILVDGIRMNTATFRTGPNQYLALIDPMALQRIEVVRGPSSVLYGSGAMGGVMHALTQEPGLGSGPLHFNGRLRGKLSSSDLTQGFAVQADTGYRDLSLLAAAHLDRFDTLRAGGGQEQPLSDYSARYWQSKLNYRGGANWSLTGAYLGASLQDTGRTDQAGKGDLRFYDNVDHLVYLLFRYQGTGIVRRVRGSLSFHRLEESIDRFNCEKNAGGTVADLSACLQLDDRQMTKRRRYRDVVNVFGGDLNVEFSLWSDRIRLNSGFEAYQELIGSSLAKADESSGFEFVTQARGNFSEGSSYRTLGAYLHLGATLLDLGFDVGQLRLTGGARFSHFSAFAPDVPDFSDVNYKYSGLVTAAGIQFLRPGIYNLYLTFVQGFRAPNLQETTNVGDTGQKYNIPNPDLRPEHSNTIEMGGRMNLGPLTASAAYFHSFNVDAIAWQATSYNGQTEIEGKKVTRMVNTLEGVTHGVEGGLGLHLWRLTLHTGLAWMQGDMKNQDGSVTPARRIPPFFGTAGLRYDSPDRSLYTEVLVRFSGRQDRLHPQDLLDARICEESPFSGTLQDPCDGTPGWTTVSLRGGLRINDRIALHLSLSNLTDEHYRNHGSGFDAPGFDARATLDLRI